jgi:copper(I)-binding protein
MKFQLIYAALVCAGLMATPARMSGQAAPPAATNALGPRMTFVTNQYHFGSVISGDRVKCVFIVSNAGDQTLEITRVSPGCHCTTVGDWSKSHKIEPGQTGEIPIQFDSGGFNGDVTRNITVTSNDKLRPAQILVLRGTIRRAFEIRPQDVRFNVMPDAPSNLTSVVHITNQLDVPVTLSNPASANGLFKAELKTIIPGKEFEVTVTAVPPLAPGNNRGTISIKTSLTNMPVINITAYAMVLPAVGVTPPQIILSPQLDRWTTNRVTITANGSKTLALSDPEASDKRVSVEIKETTPGRIFQLAAAFPPGFQIAPGQQVQLSVKSNNAERPVIVVPVRQVQRQPAMSPPLAHPKPMSQNPPPHLPATGHP